MKYGLKTVLRTPLKTLLFIILITVVTAFLSLGIGMWHSAETMLAEADAQFITAGEFVYTLGYYPHDEVYDEDLATLRQQFDINDYAGDGVTLLEEYVSHRATVPDAYIPRKVSMEYGSYGVVTFRAGEYTDGGTYIRGRVIKTYYGSEPMDDRSVLLVPHTREGVLIEPGRQYVAFGAFFIVPGFRYQGIEVLSFLEDLHISPEYGIYSPLIDVTDIDMETFWQSESGIYYQKVMETLHIINASVDVVVSQDVRIISAFHRGENVLTEGTFPDGSEPYDCVIPQRLSIQLGLGVGDTLDLSIHPATGQTGRYDSYWPDKGYAAEETYTVTGIYQSESMNTPIYLMNTGQSWLSASVNEYNLGRVMLDNRAAAAYETMVLAKLPTGVRLDINNQGYDSATRAIYSLREMALLITGVCLVAGLVVLWFFAYLFVYRSGETVNILLRLGTSAGKVMLFLLTGSSITVLAAAALGSIGGFLISKQVILSVFQSIKDNPLYDFRFSIVNKGLPNADFAPMPEVAGFVYVIIVAAVAVAALVLCVFFGLQVIRRQNPHYRFKQTAKKTLDQKKQSVALPKPSRNGSLNYDYIPGVALRFTVKSILRGGRRSLAVPLLFAVLLVFVFLFSDIREGYRQELASVYDDIPVTMWFTGASGDMRENITIKDSQIEEIEASGFTSQTWHANRYRIMYLGVEAYADGRTVESPPKPFTIPRGEFTYETFLDQLEVFSFPLVITNDFTKSSVFAQNSEPQIEWMEGVTQQDYDTSALAQTTEATDPVERVKWCMVSKNFLAANNLSIGDTIDMALFYYSNNVLLDYQSAYVIAGAYTSDIDRGTLFMPEGAFENFDVDRQGNLIHYYNGGAGFTVANTQQLSQFKDWLSERYDPIGVAGWYRRWVIMDDKTLYNTIENLTRYTGYMDLIYPVMLGAVAAIGFIASSLLLKGRVKEINALRSLGAGQIKVFFSFFMEPIFLSVPGILGGLGIAVLVTGGISAAEWGNLPLLAAFYYVGAAAAVMHTCRKAIMQSVTAEA